MYNNKPAPKSTIKRFNSIFEFFSQTSTGYFFIPPFNHKTNHKVTSCEQIESKRGIIVLDFSNDKLCGIEIADAGNLLDLEGLGIKFDNAPKIKGEFDGNK